MSRLRAVIYARFSSDKQNPLSCDDQIAELAPWIAAQGWQLVGVYRDDAVSGREFAKRAGWQGLLRAARSSERPFDLVCLFDVDRWSRKFLSSMSGAHELERRGVKIATRELGIVDFNDFADQVRFALESSLAHATSEKISKHTRRGQAQRIGIVSKAGGRAPFGYRRKPIRNEDGDTVAVELEVDESEAEIVREVFRLNVEARLGYRSIADELARRGIPTKSGKPWSHGSVRTILANRRYTGAEVVGAWISTEDPETGSRSKRRDASRERIIQGAHPAIIDPQVFAQASPQARRRAAATGEPYDRRRPVSVLSGLIKCGRCGRKVIVYGRRRADGGRYFKCSSANTASFCGGAILIESEVVEALQWWLEDEELGAVEAFREAARKIAATRLDDAVLEHARRRVADLDRRLDHMATAISQGGRLRTLVEKLAELEALRDGAAQYLEELEREARAVPDAEEIAENLASHAADYWMESAPRLRTLIASIVQRRDGSLLIHTTVGSVLALGGGVQGPPPRGGGGGRRSGGDTVERGACLAPGTTSTQHSRPIELGVLPFGAAFGAPRRPRRQS